MSKAVKDSISYDELRNYAQGIAGVINGSLGRVLTIIDAVVFDERSNKATKDLIKGAFCELHNNTSVIFRYTAGIENAGEKTEIK